MCLRPTLYVNPRLGIYNVHTCRERYLLGVSKTAEEFVHEVRSSISHEEFLDTDYCKSVNALYNSQSSFIITSDGQKVPAFVTFNCNNCVECARQYQNEIRKRAVIEGANSSYVLFYTLTYKDEHLPEHGLNKVHCVQAFKRLRTQINRYINPDITFTNLYVGEYGVDERYTMRPHYHGLLFFQGDIPLKDILKVMSLFYSFDKSYVYQNIVNKAKIEHKKCSISHWWPYGDRFDIEFPKYDNCSQLSNYVCKYITKQFDRNDKINNFLLKLETRYEAKHTWFNRPFVQMPKSIGLGCRYIDLYKDYILSGNSVLSVRDIHGNCTLVGVPAIFYDKLFRPISVLQPSSILNYRKFDSLISAFRCKLDLFKNLNSYLFVNKDIDSKIYHNRDYVTSYLDRIQTKYSVYSKIRLTKRQFQECKSIFRAAMKLHISDLLLWIMDVYQHEIIHYLDSKSFYSHIKMKSDFVSKVNSHCLPFDKLAEYRFIKSEKLQYDSVKLFYSPFSSFS